MQDRLTCAQHAPTHRHISLTPPKQRNVGSTLLILLRNECRNEALKHEHVLLLSPWDFTLPHVRAVPRSSPRTQRAHLELWHPRGGGRESDFEAPEIF